MLVFLTLGMLPAKKPIVICEYTNDWKVDFDSLCQVYLEHLENLVISVEHVGSTAVPGLCAKPVIDIDIVITTSQLQNVSAELTKLGYAFMGEVGIPERFVFRQINSSIPNNGSNKSWPKHHLYCCIENSSALSNHLILRDTLRENPILSDTYGELKKKLALESCNMEEYVLGKTEFITSILAEKGMTKQELMAIVEQNKSVIPPI